MKHKLSTNKGGQYIIAKWGKTRDSKFLEIEIVRAIEGVLRALERD